MEIPEKKALLGKKETRNGERTPKRGGASKT